MDINIYVNIPSLKAPVYLIPLLHIYHYDAVLCLLSLKTLIKLTHHQEPKHHTYFCYVNQICKTYFCMEQQLIEKPLLY